MKGKKAKMLKKKYAGSFTGKRNKKKEEEQPLFGEHDQAYNTIQEEITIVVDEMKGCRDSIDKKKERLEDLEKRKGRLEKAAATVAKLRDGALEEKAKK